MPAMVSCGSNKHLSVIAAGFPWRFTCPKAGISGSVWDRDQALPGDPVELTRTVAEVQLFAAYAQEAAARIVVPEDAESGLPALTPRELEVLRWTMEGKTAWEVGRVLGIAEQTAVRHLHHATRKLDCVNKHQAVLRALRLGLIA